MDSSESPTAKLSGSPGSWEAPSVEHLQQLFPQHEILEILGRGGMGAVYKARQKSLDRLVALKLLPRDSSRGDSDSAVRFKHEARTLAKLSHPGIVPVHDFGEAGDGQLYFVMEFIDGADVEKRIASAGPLSVQEAVRITDAVCEALSYAHERGVIHRDIKPANVLIRDDGRVLVADFGLARMMDRSQETNITRTNVAMGTQAFAAPEMLTPGAPVDHRADLYSLGVMLYQMLTGEPPRVMFKLPSRCRPELGTGFDAVICKALETDPAERFRSAAEFRRELDMAAAATSTIPVKRRGMSMLLWAAAALVVAGVAIFALKSKSPAPIPARDEPQSAATLTPQRNEWIKLLDTPEAVTRSGIKNLEWKDGWLTVLPAPERLYLVRLAGGRDKVRDMAFRATVRPPVSEWPITAILHAGADPQYNLDVHRDRLTLIRVKQVAASKPAYTRLGHVPLDLRQAKDGAFQLEASIQGNLITIMADGAKVIEVRDEGATGAGDITMATVSEAKGSGKIKDLAFRLLDESPVVAEAQGRTIDLLALIDVKRDTVSGEWNRDGGDLVVKAGASHPGSEGNPRLQLPYQPPEEYDFEIEFTPVAGGSNVYQLLSAYGSSFEWVMDVNMTVGKKAGFQLIDGASVLSREDGSAVRDHFLTNGHRHRSKVEVRKTGVRGLLDDQPLVSWGTTPNSYQSLDISRNDALRDAHHLGLAVTYRALRIHQVTVREVSGIGTVDKPDLKPASAPNAAVTAGKVTDLLPLVDVKRDAIVGEWSRTTDGLAVKRSTDASHGHPRLQLPYTPPAQYDFEIEFTPADGAGDVRQLLSAAGRSFTWTMDTGLQIGRKAGFGVLDGKAVQSNHEASIMRQQILRNGQRHVARVEVRQGVLRGILDGEELVSWRGDFNRLDLGPTSTMRDTGHLGLIAYDRAVTFHKITVHEVVGAGKLDAGLARELLPLVDVQRDTIRGSWKLEDGVLSNTKDNGYCFIRIPTVVTGSYDLRMKLRVDPASSAGRHLHFAIPHGDHGANLVIEHHETSRMGLEHLKGKPLSENGTVMQRAEPFLPLSRECDVLLRVRDGSITFEVDGKAAFEWKGSWSDLSQQGQWFEEVHDGKPVLAIGTAGDVLAIRSIELTEVDGMK